MSLNAWTKIKREHGLYRYNPSGQYFARVRFHGKLHRKKLDTDDLALAKRKLRTFKDDLERTDATKGNTSFAKVLEDYTRDAHRRKDHAGEQTRNRHKTETNVLRR